MDMMSIRRTVISNQIALMRRSGNPVGFRSASQTLPGCVANLEPDQDLHGYDSPWAAGHGKNLWNPDNVISGVALSPTSDTVFANANSTSVYIACRANTTYTISKQAGQRFRAATTKVLPAAGVDRYNFIRNDTGTSITITTGADDAYIIAFVHNVSVDGDNLSEILGTIQIEEGSSATSWSPYENICPISGWTGTTLTHTGRNMFPLTLAALQSRNTGGTWNNNAYTFRGVTMTVISDSNGYVAALNFEGTSTYSQTITFALSPFAFAGNTEYKLSGLTGASTSTYRYNVQGIANFTAEDNSITGDGASHNVRIQIGANATVSFTAYPMIRLASVTDSAFEPYTGDTYEIEFPSGAGTVYGGLLDVITGTLTVTHGLISSYNGETIPAGWISDRDTYEAGTTPTTGAQVVYELASPVSFQTTPVEIGAMTGYNTMLADTRGNIEIRFYGN